MKKKLTVIGVILIAILLLVGGYLFHEMCIRDRNNIYARIMLRREVNSIFAETALMVWTFDLLPPIIIIGFSVLNQQFVNIYFSNPIYMALFAVFLFVPFIGSFLNHGTIRKIKKGA